MDEEIYEKQHNEPGKEKKIGPLVKMLKTLDDKGLL
jgi:hypothetical protein